MKKIKDSKRVVVKIGTSTLTYENGKLNFRRIEKISRTLTDIKNSGRDVILVTSGAIGVGVGKLNLSERPQDTAAKQAAAAIGQCELMFIYDKFFGEYNQVVAQMLLTKDVTDHKQSRVNVQNTFEELLKMGVIPIVNENDSVETAELEGKNFGDNDMLSAIVSKVVGADALVILSDIDGLCDCDPRENEHAKRISVVEEITPELEAIATGTGSNRGTGGMATKIAAAKYTTDAGIPCYIINGEKMQNIFDLFDGKCTGTHFVEKE